MPTPEMRVVAKELERVKADRNHLSSRFSPGCFTFTAICYLASWGGWAPSALKPWVQAEKWKELTSWVIPGVTR